MPALQALLDGYRRFRTGPYRAERERYDQLTTGQAPGVMVVACSDSRVDPTRVFDAGPGEMFVLRNIANLVPPYDPADAASSVAAALEYAVGTLGVGYVVVFGHARCGGIAAALAEDAAGGHVRAWTAHLAPAVARVRAARALSPDIDAHRALEMAGARLSVDHLRTYPWVAAAEAAGTLRLSAAIFDIADGSLKALDPDSGSFEPVTVVL